MVIITFNQCMECAGGFAYGLLIEEIPPPPKVRYKDLGETILIRMFGYSPKLRIMDMFLDNPYFSKSEVVRELGMSEQTLYKNFKDGRNGNSQAY
ncbi:MAG: hypothetical protein ACP5K1_01925 [Candidatus Bathyarchaeia archaeon]